MPDPGPITDPGPIRGQSTAHPEPIPGRSGACLIRGRSVGDQGAIKEAISGADPGPFRSRSLAPVWGRSDAYLSRIRGAYLGSVCGAYLGSVCGRSGAALVPIRGADPGPIRGRSGVDRHRTAACSSLILAPPGSCRRNHRGQQRNDWSVERVDAAPRPSRARAARARGRVVARLASAGWRPQRRRIEELRRGAGVPRIRRGAQSV